MLPMFLKSEPGKVYDTIFFFIEYFNKCEINNEFIKKYDNSDFMLECYQKVEKRTGVVPELLHPFFFTNDKRVSPISVFFSNHYDFEYDDIDSFILKLTVNSDSIYQNTIDCVFNPYVNKEHKKLAPTIAPASYIEAMREANLPTDFKLQLSLLLGNFTYSISLLVSWIKKVYCIIDELHASHNREILLEWEQIQSPTNVELYKNELTHGVPIKRSCVSISLLQQYLVYQRVKDGGHHFLLLGLRNESALLDKVDESKVTAENFILACGSEVRIKIVNSLIEKGEMTSSQIAKHMDIPATTMIRHINTLQENGIIYVSRREKLQIFYRLNDKTLRKIKIDLDQMFDRMLNIKTER